VASSEAAGAGAAELCAAVAHVSPLQIDTVVVADYEALTDALRRGRCDLAWTPPLLAHGWIRNEGAAGLVAVGRKGGVTYHTALVVAESSAATSLQDLAGARAGWVSKLSAAGYVFPRLLLRSHDIEPAKHFSRETLYGSHDAVAHALASGEADVIASYAAPNRVTRAVEPRDIGVPVRVIASAGPIPGDVILATKDLSKEARIAVTRALLGLQVQPGGALDRLMNAMRFEPLPHKHFELLDRWLAQPAAARG
jgi:phosphonate transport system substrate-binding protein